MISKNEIRKVNKQMRSAMQKEEALQRSRTACENFLQSDIYDKSRVLMLYMPLGNETDAALIMKKALSDGKKIVLPVTDIENTDIIPYYIDVHTEFAKGAFSIHEPRNSPKADVSEIDTVVVPGIAFSKAGVRVGFGKGFYDRFLAKSKAVKVGFCYDFQICGDIKGDVHDIMMDYIASESGIIDCSNSENNRA